ncbi:DNA-processing protein DprA [Pectobacterium polaris]|uniref:DNA-processing protein DprA n=1 Tax=Pectobacterium polaris TaxID=2042057 RepID=UPI000ADF4997|nr:DNA-processing protein DprA [Pectobacterium polaris]ASY77445.1 DNA processing protein DprA [Pectobacterium polaris]
MNLSPTAQATLLLTCYFSKASVDDLKPLTNTEWGRFALWLKEKSLSPADLLMPDPTAQLSGWHDSRVSVARIVQLLGRGHSLALAIEKWQRAGLWVVTRSDYDYPKRLKQRLKSDSPPVLFGCGNRTLLNTSGLAVVGSRNANAMDLSFTHQVGIQAAADDIAIVSGGARGVDETAMLGAMSQGGVVIGVMADSLLKASTSTKWRKGLMEGRAVLVSPFHPEAGFSTGNAMARNKYIYCLAESALVVHSGKNGGTFSGAQENLKKGWVPLWVKPTDEESAGNADLVIAGGRWCDMDWRSLSVAGLLEQVNSVSTSVALGRQGSLVLREEPQTALSDQPIDFYTLFLQELSRLAVEAVSLDELISLTALHKSQLTVWLQRAVDEGVISKQDRPIRYQWIANPS